MSKLDKQIEFKNKIKVLNQKIKESKSTFFNVLSSAEKKQQALSNWNTLKEERENLINDFWAALGISPEQLAEFRRSLVSKEVVLPEEWTLDFLSINEEADYENNVIAYLENEDLIAELEEMIKKLEAELSLESAENVGDLNTSNAEQAISSLNDLLADPKISASKKSKLMLKLEELKAKLQQALMLRQQLNQIIEKYQQKNKELQLQYEQRREKEREKEFNFNFKKRRNKNTSFSF